MQPSEHYRAVRASVTAFAQDLTPDQLATRVPGCPDWTVRELLSHLSGLSADLVAGTLDGAGSPPWTAQQVADRQERSRDELLAEWDTCAPTVEAVMDDLGEAGYRVFYDAAMHEDDLREALGLPAAADPTHAEVLNGLCAGAQQRISKAGLPPLAIRAGEQTWGAPDAVTSVTVPDAGELARALSGRRPLAQVRSYAWEGDAEPYLAHLPMFAPGESF